MRRRGAAPEGRLAASPSEGGLSNGVALNSTAFQATLAPALIERLAWHGIRSLKDWRRLGAQRRTIFGITSRMVAQLDDLAKAAP